MASNSKLNALTRQFVRRMLRVVEVPDDSIVIIKSSEAEDRYQLFNKVRSSLIAMGKERVLVIALDDLDAISVLDPKEMEQYGWQPRASGEEA